MAKTENNLIKADHQSVRYCGNCKKEYTFDNYIRNYPKSHHDQLMKFWYNQKIQFYCSYCYLLKIIKKINEEKKLIA